MPAPDGLGLKPGDWVRVWGQVVDRPKHPEDVVVEFFSHNSNYAADVRADRVVYDPNSPFATKCTALHVAEGYDQDDGVYMRCLRTNGHANLHEDYDGAEWHTADGIHVDE